MKNIPHCRSCRPMNLFNHLTYLTHLTLVATSVRHTDFIPVLYRFYSCNPQPIHSRSCLALLWSCLIIVIRKFHEGGNPRLDTDRRIA
jgi:hypothetical protein